MRNMAGVQRLAESLLGAWSAQPVTLCVALRSEHTHAAGLGMGGRAWQEATLSPVVLHGTESMLVLSESFRAALGCAADANLQEAMKDVGGVRVDGRMMRIAAVEHVEGDTSGSLLRLRLEA